MPFDKKYSDEQKEKAVLSFQEARDNGLSQAEALKYAAHEYGIENQSLRNELRKRADEVGYKRNEVLLRPVSRFEADSPTRSKRTISEELLEAQGEIKALKNVIEMLTGRKGL